MKITAYVHLFRTYNPTTGVGKHIINMMHGLSKYPDVELSLLASRDTLDRNKEVPADSRLAGFKAHSFPLQLRIMEQLWRRLNFPSADRFIPPTDWLYCPAESYVTTRAKLAATIHDVAAFEPDLPWSHTPKHKRFRKSFGLMFKRLKQTATVFLTVSEFSKKRLSEILSIDPARIAVVGNGVEEEYYQPASPDQLWHIGDGDPYILIVGGINARKGGEQVIRLAETLLQQSSPLKIKAAGLHDAPLLERAVKLPNFTNLGFINDQALLLATRKAAISMLLSRYEGFGIPSLEAMAAGVPAIVSPHAALPEIAGDGGIIVQPEDSNAIADVCHNLISDPTFRADTIARGRANAEKFHWAACARRLHQTLLKHS